MYLLYNLLLLFAAGLLVPIYLLRGYRYGKSRRGIRERLGYFSAVQVQQLNARRIIWVHAVSVGETRAAEPLLRELRRAYPEHLLLLTNVTETGHAMGLENPHVDCCLFFPFDFSWTVRRILQRLKPDLVVIVETEIWPNFVHEAHQLGVPLVLVNGRLSDRSYPRYRRFHLMLRPVLQSFSAFCMQSQLDAERICQLGAEVDRVENTGNLKFDHQLRNVSAADICALKERYRLPEQLPIWVAGSTHAGEEVLLLQTYRRLLAQGCKLQFIVIPRHPERGRELLALLKELQLDGCLRSELTADSVPLAGGQVLIIDTLGEVLDVYAVADLVFVGGSLVPVGGHNLLEAALVGKPVLFGPHVHNFREISAKLVDAGAGIKIQDQGQLEQQCARLLADPTKCYAMGQAGRALIADNAGATERTMRRIVPYVRDR